MADPTPHEPAIAPHFIEKTARYRELDRFRRYLDSTQYEGRPDFFTGLNARGEKVPLRERKPAIVYPLPLNACKEATRFTFGEGRFPTIQVKAVEADAAIGGLGLELADAKLLQQANADIIEQAHLRTVMRALEQAALGCRTSVAILCVRDGRFCVDQPRAQDCIATFVRAGDPASAVAGLTICYQFDKEIADRKTGAPTIVRHWYRRDITATHDIRYEDVAIDAARPDEPPRWVVDESQSVEHAFGFCPVVWARNLPDPSCGSIDGTSLLENLFEEVDALNLAYSQRHRGIVHFGTPQPYETGVAEDDGPQATGRKSGPAGWGQGGAPFGGVCSPASPARVAAPDKIWSYQGKDVQVGLIETTGAAFNAATLHVDDISARLKQSMGVVLANAADVMGKGDMSAKFLALAYAPLLALVDDLRECWWDACLRPLLEMAMRIVVVRSGKGLLLPRAAAVAALLAKRTVTVDSGETVWVAPELQPLWGNYFSPSNEDIKTDVLTAQTAQDAKLATKKTVVSYVAKHFGVRDVDDELAAIDPPVEDDAPVVDTTTAEPVESSVPTLSLTSTDVASIVTVNEARQSQGLAPWVRAEGSLTVTEFQAKNAALVAAAAGAAMGQVVDDPADDAPDDPPPSFGKPDAAADAEDDTPPNPNEDSE
jgi:hypothetical protein